MFTTVEFEPLRLPDGRKVITDAMVAEEPAIADLIERFPDYWHRDYLARVWTSPPAKDAGK